MAARPKTICRKVSCGRLIDSPGYCDKHTQLAAGWTRSHDGKSSAARGYGHAWRKTRERIMARDCGLCQISGEACSVIATEVDHKVSKARARELGWTAAQIEDDANLQAACNSCHKEKTAAERG